MQKRGASCAATFVPKNNNTHFQLLILIASAQSRATVNFTENLTTILLTLVNFYAHQLKLLAIIQKHTMFSGTVKFSDTRLYDARR
jgi:hypothetical protein